MDETILFPSPNWFQASVLAVSNDGWLFYGGTSKSLCVLQPLPDDYNGVLNSSQRYHAHVTNKAHSEKIVSVDITPAWATNRCILTGSTDGIVKQWTIQENQKVLDIKATHSHNMHAQEKEEVVGVGYSTEICAITVGSFGYIVKWDLNSNVVKTYANLMKFKPTCMACSPHIPLTVAVGTKQGVVILLDLNGNGKILYKVRGHDDDIMNIGWCPQYEINIKKTLVESKKKFCVSDRLNRIRGITTDSMSSDVSKTEVESDNSKVENKPEAKSSEHKKGDSGNQSGIAKDLPNDSFEEMEIITDDDMFDIYKDHESDEFGHKKYQPEDIIVKVKEDTKYTGDFLVECDKLKDQILKKKNESEVSIEELVDALDKTHVDNERAVHSRQSDDTSSKLDNDIAEPVSSIAEFSVHIHRHLLASIGKQGSVRVWSKSGKLVGACTVPNVNYIKNSRKKEVKAPQWTTLLWYKPDVLLIGDGRSQLLKCNPLQIDCKNKLSWSLVHNLHNRGLFCIASNAPRVQSVEQSGDQSAEAQWHVWTASQDRSLNCYSMTENKLISTHMTCGGFPYDIRPCPYDASRIAISVGDGAVRVWEADTLIEDDSKLNAGHVAVYWQNVQGKVLTVAWHPDKENCLAFATAEARVGLLEASGKGDRGARLLSPAGGSPYTLSWGADDCLYASAAGKLLVYKTSRADDDAEVVPVEVQGQKWQVTASRWHPRGLLCGNHVGAVALLTPAPPYAVRAVAFPFTKMLHTMEWHPQETSILNAQSPNKNLIAVCSLDKKSDVVILEYKQNEDGSEALEIWKNLSGHRAPVLSVAWNPHVEAQLLSTSQDSTVRIWDVTNGVCTSIFDGHVNSSFSATWSLMPQFATKVFSGGADCCLRLWDINDHPVEAYDETRVKVTKKKKYYKKNKPMEPRAESPSSDVGRIATMVETKHKPPRKFLLPLMHKQMNLNKVQAVRKMLEKMNPDAIDMKVKTENSLDDSKDFGIDYIKLFGNASEVNAYLDMEMARLAELGLLEAWSVLCALRGDTDALLRRAAARDELDPFLLTLAAGVSTKYWKDAVHMYLAQIDRLVAKDEEDRLCENKSYGGPVYRKVVTLLSIHDVVGALNTLTEARLFKEAYVLCRIRYLESFTDTILYRWAQDSCIDGQWVMAAVCYIALGNLSQAAVVLSKSYDEECLSMSAELAKLTGQTAFAEHMEKKAQHSKQTPSDTNSEDVQLASKADLLLKGIVKNNVTQEVVFEESNSDKNERSRTSSSIAPETDENSQLQSNVGMDNESTSDESDEKSEEGAAPALELRVEENAKVGESEVTKDKCVLSQLEDAINENNL